MNNLRERGVEKELKFSASRSSGAGGQNVNKVSTKVELSWHISDSDILTNDEKEIISSKLSSLINELGFLKLSCEETRSQLKNKELVLKKLFKYLEKAFHKPKVRKVSKPSKTALLKKKKDKMVLSEKKANRKILKNIL